MVESFRRVYVSAPIKMEAKNKVAQLWNHTVVCKFGTLLGYLVAGVSFALVVEKGLTQDKSRPVKISYLSRDKIGKTGKYRETVKSEKQKKNRGTLVPSNFNLFLQISIKNMSGLYQTSETSPVPF